MVVAASGARFGITMVMHIALMIGCQERRYIYMRFLSGRSRDLSLFTMHTNNLLLEDTVEDDRSEKESSRAAVVNIPRPPGSLLL